MGKTPSAHTFEAGPPLLPPVLLGFCSIEGLSGSIQLCCSEVSNSPRDDPTVRVVGAGMSCRGPCPIQSLGLEWPLLPLPSKAYSTLTHREPSESRVGGRDPKEPHADSDPIALPDHPAIFPQPYLQVQELTCPSRPSRVPEPMNLSANLCRSLLLSTSWSISEPQ